MLKKQYRLDSFFLKNSKQFSGALFNFKVSENGLGINRFAFVVSKKVDQRAVARNRLKRVLRSCIEEIFDNIKMGKDFIFYPKKEILTVTRDQVLKEVKNTLEKEKFIK